MKTILRSSSLILCAAILLSFTTRASSAAPVNTGIQGRTFIYSGPIWVGPPPAVIPAVVWLFPVATTFTVVSSHTAKVVAQVTTDEAGDFALPLNPGRYLIVPHPLNNTWVCSYQTPEPFEVTVRAHEISGAGFIYIGSCHGIVAPHSE